MTRIAPGLVVSDAAGGVRVVARDWPWAGWTAAAFLAPGLALVVWSAATRHWIELGGGVVFCAAGAASAVLALARRRDVEIRAGADGVSMSGVEGAGPFRRDVSRGFGGRVRLEIRPLPTPDGAPTLDDRGGDLVLVGAEGEAMLARRVGVGWRAVLETARTRVAAGIPGVLDTLADDRASA